jgi:hypothetical protein
MMPDRRVPCAQRSPEGKAGHPRSWRCAGRTLHGAVLAVAALALTASADDVMIPASAARQFVGQRKIVEGRVAAAQRDGNVVRLRLGNAPDALTVTLLIGVLSQSPAEPERYYLGTTVRADGTIQSFRGALEMVMHDASRIQIVDMAASSAAPDPQPTTGTETSTEQQLRELHERVRRLEHRVERSEHPTAGAEGR